MEAAFSLDSQKYSFELYPYLSNFIAELVLIYKALKYIIQQPPMNFIIYSDSLSVLTALASCIS